MSRCRDKDKREIAAGFPTDFLTEAVYTGADISVCTPGTSSSDESSTGLKFRFGRRGKVLMDCIMPRIHGLLGEYGKRSQGMIRGRRKGAHPVETDRLEAFVPVPAS